MNIKNYVVLSLIIIFSMFCSQSKQNKTTKRVNNKKKMQRMIAEQQKAEQFLYQDDKDTTSSKKTSYKEDTGTPCESHRYLLKPGTDKSLTFSIKVKQDCAVGSVESIISNNSKLEDFEIGADLVNSEIEKIDVEYPVWTIYDANISLPKNKTLMFVLTAFKGSNVWVYFMKGSSTGYLAFEGGSPEQFGLYNKEELLKMLGSEELIIKQHDYSIGKNKIWEIERNTLDASVKILTYEIYFSMPKESNKFSTNLTIKSSIGSKKLEDTSIYIKYLPFEKIYIISGSGFGVNCNEDF